MAKGGIMHVLTMWEKSESALPIETSFITFNLQTVIVDTLEHSARLDNVQ